MAGIGVSQLYYAKYNYDETSKAVTYQDGGLIGKAINVNVAINQSSDNNLYADNGVAETDKRFSDGTLTTETDDLGQTVSRVILGLKEQKLDTIKGVTDEDVLELVYDDDMAAPYLGVGFIIKKKVNGAIKWRGMVLTKVQYEVPEDAAETEGQTVTWKTPSLTATIMRDDTEKHTWKREATFTTEAQAAAYIKHVLEITA